VTRSPWPLRYLRLFGVQVRASLLFALQYRSDFLFDGVVEILWALSDILPVFIVLGAGTHTLGGWTYDEALVVLGWFTMLKALTEGAVFPSVTAVVEHVRKGTLDLVLLKPKDAQFLVSTARFFPWRSINVLTGIALVVVALARLGRVPTVGGVLAALLLLIDGVVVLYALLVATVCVAFFAVRVDNLPFLLTAVFDTARWPKTAFRGVARQIFTFVLPFVLMTTYPAEALLGRLPASTLLFATLGAAAFATGSRLVWLRSIRSYTSAGG
jgi:ABC-2 type transport system permease protein